MDLKQTRQLLVRASAIDSRHINDMMVAAWQEVLAAVNYDAAVAALIQHRRSQPGVYLEPGHIVQQIKVARARHVETYGIHPPPPPGKRWAVDVIENDPTLAINR